MLLRLSWAENSPYMNQENKPQSLKYIGAPLRLLLFNEELARNQKASFKACLCSAGLMLNSDCFQEISRCQQKARL